MKYIRYLVALIPLALGILLAVLWQSGLWANPVLLVRFDVGTMFLGLGILGTILWGGSVALRASADRRWRHYLDAFQQEHADSHRRFIRRLDHELKNPLTAIRAGLANLDDRDEGPALSSVRAQVDRLARLSADLRKLADLETQPVEREAVDLNELLNELVELSQEGAEAGQRQLEMTLPRAPWPLPPVPGDRDLLFLALHNLVVNALKFTRPQDRIEIRALEDGSSVVIEVADTGPGIPDDELPHLGEELYRGSAARSVEGSGLGLALVRTIVARHAGTFAVRSRVGQGTVMTVRLPVSR